MEIIKQGRDLTTMLFTFVCPECECEFTATKDELFAENKYNCPNCGFECVGILQGE